jgi:hypothetical protein
LGRQIINTKRKGLSPRFKLRLAVLAVVLVVIAVGVYLWLHGHAASVAFVSTAARLGSGTLSLAVAGAIHGCSGRLASCSHEVIRS